MYSLKGPDPDPVHLASMPASRILRPRTSEVWIAVELFQRFESLDASTDSTPALLYTAGASVLTLKLFRSICFSKDSMSRAAAAATNFWPRRWRELTTADTGLYRSAPNQLILIGPSYSEDWFFSREAEGNFLLATMGVWL